MISNYKKIAFKKNPILLYHKIDELRIFRHSHESDVDLLKNIKNELLKRL